MIRKANISELNSVYQLSIKAKAKMLDEGLNQWVGDYPHLSQFEMDCQNGGLYIYIEDGKILASISILAENDLPYKDIDWASDDGLVIHRLFVDPEFHHKGLGQELFKWAIKLGKEENKNIKVDTHPDNLKMQNLIMKMQFKYVGYLKSINRLAYEFIL